MSVSPAGGAGEAAVGGGEAIASSNMEFGDQTLLTAIAAKYEKMPHNIYSSHKGGFTIKSGRSIEHDGKLYFVIEKGANTLKALERELEITKYASNPSYESAPYVSKLVAAKLNPTPVVGRKRSYSGLFVFDSENSQSIDLREFLKYRGRNIDVTNQRIYDDLHTAIEALHAVGIVHRDIKPENVVILYKTYAPDGKLIRSPTPYPYVGLRIIDFGFAEEMETPVTPAGTRGYMPDPYPSTATPNLNKYALEKIARNNLGYGIVRKARKTQRRRQGRSRRSRA